MSKAIGPTPGHKLVGYVVEPRSGPKPTPPGSDCICGRYQDESHKEGCANSSWSWKPRQDQKLPSISIRETPFEYEERHKVAGYHSYIKWQPSEPPEEVKKLLENPYTYTVVIKNAIHSSKYRKMKSDS